MQLRRLQYNSFSIQPVTSKLRENGKSTHFPSLSASTAKSRRLTLQGQAPSGLGGGPPGGRGNEKDKKVSHIIRNPSRQQHIMLILVVIASSRSRVRLRHTASTQEMGTSCPHPLWQEKEEGTRCCQQASASLPDYEVQIEDVEAGKNQGLPHSGRRYVESSTSVRDGRLINPSCLQSSSRIKRV